MDRNVLRTRSTTAFIFAIIVIGGLLGGKIPAMILLGIIGFGSGVEYLRMTQKNSVIILGLAGLLFLGVSVFLALQPVPQFVLFLMIIGHLVYIAVSVIQLWRPVLPHSSFYPVHVILYTMLPLWIGIYAIRWLAPDAHFVLYTLFLIWISDSGAYFVGSLWGKKKLFERLSPKKTQEGFLGAGVLTLVFAWLFSMWIPEFSLNQWLILGFWSWLVGTFGDLYESSVKRTFRVKDSGRFMPGHGGFLDRFDSFLFVISFSVWLIWLVV